MKIQTALALSSSLTFFALVPTAASSAEAQDEQNACMGDAFSVCGHAIPDRDRVAACLARNINRISMPCRTVMLRYSKPTNPPMIATRAKLSTRD
jgi:hypothetical protein